MPETPLILASEVSAVQWPRFASMDSAGQAQLVGAATDAIDRFCDRILGQSTQHEIHTPGRAEDIRLRQYPVQSVSTVRAGLVTALAIANVSASVQRATVTLTTTGPPYDLTPTGISIAGTSSGVTTTTPFLFSAYPTLGQLAAAINAAGGGWQAVVNPSGDQSRGGFGPYATADLLPDMGSQQALASTGTPSGALAGARLKMYARDLDYGLDINGDSRRGRITLFESFPDGYRFPDRQFSGSYGYGSGQGMGGGFGFGGGFGGAGSTSTSGSWGSDPRIGGVRVEYTAGWATADVPTDLKQACVMAAKFLFEATFHTGRMKSETIGEYSYTTADMVGLALPANVCAMLANYRRVELI